MIVIDTSVLIDALHGKQAALGKILELEETGETLCTTQVKRRAAPRMPRLLATGCSAAV